MFLTKKHISRFPGNYLSASATNKAFQHVETLFVQGRNLVPSRPAISGQDLFTFRPPIADLLGARFLLWTNKVSTCWKALLCTWGGQWGPPYLKQFMFSFWWGINSKLFSSVWCKINRKSVISIQNLVRFFNMLKLNFHSPDICW